MRLMRAVMTLVFAIAMIGIPAIAQTSTDHNDTNSKTKKAMKKAADKTSDAASDTADATKSGAKKTKAAATGESSEKMDINAATKEQLATLPGIGDVLSQKIIDNRPYNAKSDLVKKNVIPQGTYDKIKDQIIAHRVKSSTTTAASSKKSHAATASGGTAAGSSTTPK